MNKPARRVFLGLGSNLGNRAGYLRDAVAALPDLVGISSVYETAPVGGPQQGPYLNLVAELHTAISGLELLATCQSLENAAQRVRQVHWGARTLDVDVLWIDGENFSSPELVVPHPRMFERSFVLIPLSELATDLVPASFNLSEASRRDQVTCIGALSHAKPPNRA